MRFALATVLVTGAVTAAPAQEAPPPTPGDVRGTVALAVEGVRLADMGPVVAYLDGVEGPLVAEVPTEIPAISQRDARFTPNFLVIAAGQSVAFPNDDVIVHNVFSFSKPNDFDLGLYPKGERKTVTFRTPGVVRIYCSIHQTMNAVIYVAPTRHHATADAVGAFALRAVPPGRYRLRVWNAKLPEVAQEIEVRGGEETRAVLTIAPRPPPAAPPAPGRAPEKRG